MHSHRDRQRSVPQLADHFDAWAVEVGAWEVGRRDRVGPFQVLRPSRLALLRPGRG